MSKTYVYIVFKINSNGCGDIDAVYASRRKAINKAVKNMKDSKKCWEMKNSELRDIADFYTQVHEIIK